MPVLVMQTTNDNRDEGTAQSGAESTGSIQGSVSIRYLHRSPLVVRGAKTGRHYLFSSGQPVLAVDARDVESVLRIGVFRKD